MKKKEGFAGDFSTLRRVQIPPPALFKETATLFELLSLPYDHSSGIEPPIPKQTKQKKKGR